MGNLLTSIKSEIYQTNLKLAIGVMITWVNSIISLPSQHALRVLIFLIMALSMLKLEVSCHESN